MNPDLGATLTFGILSVFVLIFGWRRGFFIFPAKPWETPVRFYQLIGAFAIYFLVTTFLSAVAVALLKKQILAHYAIYSNWINFALSFLIFFFLSIYWCFLPKQVTRSIVRRPGEKHSLAEDAGSALFAWILAFPFVLFLSQALETLVFHVFKVTKVPDQVAVKFLKSTFENPAYLVLAVISIVILAPLIEETLFRGFLQSYIRRHLGSKQAILITSVCFSLFHYSAGQGLANISIIISLFVLSLFLGFLYEKRGSIFSSMILHSFFNTFSVVNLYFFGGFSTAI